MKIEKRKTSNPSPWPSPARGEGKRGKFDNIPIVTQEDLNES